MTIKEYSKMTGLSTTSIRKYIHMQRLEAKLVRKPVPIAGQLRIRTVWEINENSADIEELKKRAITYNTSGGVHKQRKRKNVTSTSEMNLPEVMDYLKKWCKKHPDSDIKNIDYGKATLRGIIE